MSAASAAACRSCLPAAVVEVLPAGLPYPPLAGAG